MDDNAEQQRPTTAVSVDFAHGQLARAFVTALSHPDAETRSGAENRQERWRAVLAGMKDGSLRIGTRAPVAGLPVWVTPEVLRGGFASGRACAEGPLQPYEARACREAGIPADRAGLFAHSLTEAGLARLWELLDSGRYRVTVPEEAALLTVAWLVRAGEQGAALELAAVLAPFAARLRFTPQTGDGPASDPDAVHRQTVADTVATLERRGPNRSVETQREALAVWLPFSDELLAHWLETAGIGRVPEHGPGPDWHQRGAELLFRYAAVRAAPQDRPVRGRRSGTASGFSVLCRERAGRASADWSVAGNGTVIEQAQILTTHNLATLVGVAGVTPVDGWDTLARRAFDTACRLVLRAEQLPHPLAAVKNAAFAWRQMVFHLSLCAPRTREAVLDRLAGDHPARLAPAVAGLVLTAAGGRFEDDGTADGGASRRLLGWTVGPHWLLRRS
ncbi:hypothetical protein [Kitasatospora sp. NPDC088346]|uniref:hypothetical protein n=1 Tax=Kitasatospora sp. NPDC088346 TaxID=3364073 RepID=UPI00381F0EA3